MTKTMAGWSKTDTDLISYILKKEQLFPDFESFENLRPELLSVLAGGKNAAVYLVRVPKRQVVIKIDDQGIEAEAEAFAAWRTRGARVPDVYAIGELPAKSPDGKRLKYIVERAMTTKHGVVAETCANYLAHAPGQARNIGRLLGVELTKMHRAVARRSFGEFADSWGNTAPYQSWSSYLTAYLGHKSGYLNKIGITGQDIEKVLRYTSHCRFVTTGRYLHGDFSIRNAVVRFEPLKVGIFDPNPVIGDPTWDIAVLYNNYEFSRRRFAADGRHEDLFNRDKQLLIGFKQGYGRKVNPDALRVAQLLQAVLQAEATENKIQKKKSDDIDLKVRHDFILELAGGMTREAHDE